ncbi:uncharacterized protein [Euwallacea similis]|uniref:uncharacterized protein isoform X3 n=1 Tax=Euwallacea similis TaxID=1736056 RepID=UPI00344EC2AF
MTKVCRLCLAKLQRGSKYFNINAVESFTGFMPYRDQLTTCIPEMVSLPSALDMIPNPVICNSCRNALKCSYDFKSRCLLVEKKIRQYVENQPSETTVYNLSEIDISDLPKAARYEAEAPKLVPLLPKLEVKSNSQPPSILSDLLTVREEVILPNPAEIEITNINYDAAIPKVRIPRFKPVEPALYKPIVKDEHGLLTCNHCDKKFSTVPALHTHKTKVHDEDYLCNFCNVPFKTLQSLRKHNQLCQKVATTTPTEPAILTKRPHLPTKAKNHLKRWLFNHTDHPYPTDVEKQQLMKETNLSLLQVENWFINARRRILADLTRLKSLKSHGPIRGRRGGRGRGRAKYEAELISALEEELFEEDHEALLEDMATDDSGMSSRLLRDLEEDSEISIQEHGVGEMNEIVEENSEETSEKDAEEEEEQDVKDVLKNVVTMSPSYQFRPCTEEEEEQDPLEDVPLSVLTTIKTEVMDIDER